MEGTDSIIGRGTPIDGLLNRARLWGYYCAEMSRIFGGIDLGGTKIYSVVATAEGDVLGEDERPTESDAGADSVVARMVDSLRAASDAAGASFRDLTRIAVAAPGPIDIDAGVVTAAPNLGWTDVPLRSLLARGLQAEVLLENDANAAALGEFVYGAGKPYDTMVYVTISTGIGGGFVFDGKIFHGASGAAGEIGHITVEPSGPTCFCGNRGCLEIVASGTAIGRIATEAVKAGRSETMQRLADDPEEIDSEDVARAAAEGDPVANEILDEAARYIGIGFGSLINLVNPQAIVVGGGVSKLGARILDPATAEAKRRSFPQSFGDCTITLAKLGSRVGALGAVAVANSHA